MMSRINPVYLLVVGFVLLLLGFALPALMIMRILPSTFLLNFLSYIASFLGVMLGIVGSLFIAVRRRK